MSLASVRPAPAWGAQPPENKGQYPKGNNR